MDAALAASAEALAGLAAQYGVSLPLPPKPAAGAAAGADGEGGDAAGAAAPAAPAATAAPAVAGAAGVFRRVDAASPSPAVIFSSSIKPLFAAQVALLVGPKGSGRSEFAVRAARELGYTTLKVSSLLREEMDAASDLSGPIAEALASKRTLAPAIAVAVIHKAVLRSHCSRILIDGYPRTVSVGFPSVHDQVFALEARVGTVKGCVSLSAELPTLVERAGAKTPGEIAAVRAMREAYLREKASTVTFFSRIGKAAVIDAASQSPDAVFEAARPLLQ